MRGYGTKVGLELGDINVECTIETKRRRDRRDDLCDEAVQVGVRWALNVEAAAADVVDCLVVKHDGNVGVLKHRVGREDRVVWLDNSGGDLWGRVDSELELGLAAVVDREALKEQRSKTGSGTSSNGVEAQGIPEDQCSCPQACGGGRGRGPRSPYRWCSDHGRSCWRHLPCR